MISFLLLRITSHGRAGRVTVAYAGIEQRRSLGGHSDPAPTIQYVPAPPPRDTAISVAKKSIQPTPASTVDAARRISLGGKPPTPQGRISTILAPRGSLQDEVTSLLGNL